MSAFDLSSLATPPAAGSRIFRGFIAEDATDPNQFVEVRIPAYHASRTFGPCSFMPRPLRSGGLMYPLRNDPCMVALDEHEQADLINWWAEDPTANQAFAARLTALESAVAAGIPVVTSLPTTGLVNGQRVIYKFQQTVNPVDAKWIFWPLYYDLASNLWYPMGDLEPVYAFRGPMDAFTGYGGGVWGGINANDPTATAPLAGTYRVEWGLGQMYVTSNAGNWFVSCAPSTGDITPNGTQPDHDVLSPMSGPAFSGGSTSKSMSIASGQTLRHRYYVTAGGNLSRSGAFIKMFPRTITP